MWAVDVTNSLFRTEVNRKSYYIERQVLVPDAYTFVFDGSSCLVLRPKTEEANNNAA